MIGEALSEEKKAVRPQFKSRNFWIGLPVVLLFASACWIGFLYAGNQILTERGVGEQDLVEEVGRGVVASGAVIEKTRQHSNDSSQDTFSVTYEFRTPAGLTIHREIRVEPELWYRLKENSPIKIRYVPDRPEINLPDGRHMAGFYYVGGGIALAGALLFTVVLIGMLAKKLTGGYRGETHPFLGNRSPGQGM